MTLIWSFLLVTLLNYVVGSIADLPFNLEAGIVISVILAVLVIALGEILPEESVSDH